MKKGLVHLAVAAALLALPMAATPGAPSRRSSGMGAQLREHREGVIRVNFNPASIAAATTAEQTLTVPGLKVGDIVVVQKPTLTAGVGIAGARVSAADTLAITFINATAGALDPGAEDYLVFWMRPEKVATAVET